MSLLGGWALTGGFHSPGLPCGSDGKESACNAGDWVWFLGWEHPLVKGMETHSSIIAWRIPWIEKPDVLQSIRLQRVGHNWATSTKLLSWHLPVAWGHPWSRMEGPHSATQPLLHRLHCTINSNFCTLSLYLETQRSLLCASEKVSLTYLNPC